MKKLLFVLYWIVVIYSGNSGRRIFKTMERPIFDYSGRWIHFTDTNGKDTYISAGSTVVLYEEK